MIYTCKICDLVCKSGFSFGKHLKHTHTLNIESYYIKYISEPPMCEVCNTTPTKFLSYYIRYSRSCCRKCMGILSRRNLKLDSIKYNAFVDKVRVNVTNDWATKDQSIRIENMTQSITKRVSSMSKEERKEKYGWMNKLSDSEKQKYIDEVVMTGGMVLWWKTASEERKQECYSLQRKHMDMFYANQPNQPYEPYKEMSHKEYELMAISFCQIFDIYNDPQKHVSNVTYDFTSKSVLERFGINL